MPAEIPIRSGYPKLFIETLRTICNWRSVAVAVSSIYCLLGPVIASGSEVVSVSGGPDGGWSIHSGGSEFYVIPIGGGFFWTGTPREYDIGRANGLARDMGLRRSIVADGATAAYVGRDSKRVSFATGGVDALEGYIVSSATRRPRSLRNAHYLDFLWIQSRNIHVTTRLIDLANHRIWNAARVDRRASNAPYAVDEYVFGDAYAKDPIVLLVTVGKTTKGIAFRSAAWATYQSRSADIRNAGREVDGDDRRDLAVLRKLDPSVPSSFQIVTPANQAAETASPRETDTPIEMAPPRHNSLDESPRVFVGSIVDELGGKGTARITLLRNYDFFDGSIYVDSLSPPMVFTVHGRHDGDRVAFEMEAVNTHCQYHGEGTLKGGRLEATYKPTSCQRAHAGTISAERSP